MAKNSGSKSEKKASKAGKKPAEPLLASGGGNATAAGVTFQGWVGALFAAAGMAQRPLDERLGLGNEQLAAFRFETEAPVDDVLITTSASGNLFFQAKNTLSLSTGLTSELGKTAEQMVRQWRACEAGDGSKGWDRSIDPNLDRFVIAVGADTPDTVAAHLATALSRRRALATTEVTPKTQTDALTKFSDLLKAAWRKIYDSEPSDAQITAILDVVVVLRFDFAGADLAFGTEVLGSGLAQSPTARSAFGTLASICESCMKDRTGFNVPQIRRKLEQQGVELLAPPDYRHDHDRFRAFSQHMRESLKHSAEVRVDQTTSIPVPRRVTEAAALAAAEGSLLIVGEPGAGKTGVVTDLAQRLEAEGKQVLMLAVDRTAISSSDGLRSEIGLEHPIRDVLSEWPGTGAAYLLIDGLDATRGGPSGLVYRNLIADTIGFPGGRWKVVATVRSFDLQLGHQFKALFSGPPPDPQRRVSGSDFNNVRHIQVRPWDEDELKLLLDSAPKLRDAIHIGGSRLHELALVPFNTQLLADVLASEVDDAELGSIRNQTELLKLYWSHRVQAFGSPATECLKSTVETMIHEQSLRVRQDSVRQLHAVALDQMLGSGVLVAQSNDRFVSFRHNILFDYAASRLFLDPYESASLHNTFLRERGLGLLLSPALGYSLQEAWDSEDSRASFWDVIVLLASDKSLDPVARSVIARASCELPQLTADVRELLARLSDTQASHEALLAMTGALTILLEDTPLAVRPAPWAALLEQLSASPRFDNIVTFLLDRLLKLPNDTASFRQFGIAARNLMTRAVATTDLATTQRLAQFSIGHVAKTFASDAKASRALLERVFEPQRLASLAHTDVPALAHEIKSIAPFDLEFTATIFGAVFAHDVSSRKRTSISPSQIMSMTSDEAQDYDLARYSLSQFFPSYLASNPVAGIEALIRVLEARLTQEDQVIADQVAQTLNTGGHNIRLLEDGSSIWAWEVESSHPDHIQGMIQAFVKFLRNTSKEDAETVVSALMKHNRLAILWARLLMVAAELPEIFADRLWTVATHEGILFCPDTQKDAIDAIAAFYPLRHEEDRRQFETGVLTRDFGTDAHAIATRDSFLATVFGAIESELLATGEARAYLATAATEDADNARLYDLTPTISPFTSRQWLEEQGVDLATTVHSSLLALSETVKANLGLGQNQTARKEDIPAVVAQLRELHAAIEDARANHSDPQVVRTAQGVLSDVCTLVQRTVGSDATAITDDEMSALKGAVLSLSYATYPIGDEEEEARFSRSLIMGGPSPRADAVPQLFYLCQQAATAEGAIERLEEMLADSHPSVRYHLAKNIATLWNHNRSAMWRFAEEMATKEKNPAVLAQFVHSFLAGLRNLEPERVESLVLQIQERFPPAVPARGVRGEENLFEFLAGITAMLYVWNGRARAQERLFEWIADPVKYHDLIRMALFSVRQAVCEGYDSDTPEHQVARDRSQSLVDAVVERTADWLTSYTKLDPEAQNAARPDYEIYARCMDYAGGSLFYAPGAFRERSTPNISPIKSDAGKIRFLTDLLPALERLGTIATPHTMWQLVQLLEFLLPAKPDLCFDLFARALTTGGHQHGFQKETLGVDVLVRIVGRCLADYAYIFQDRVRRQLLIACLDVFIEAGWPAAQRLLYRLPDALR